MLSANAVAGRLLGVRMTRCAGHRAMVSSRGVRPPVEVRQARQPLYVATGLPFRHAQFVQRLKIQPELGTGTEEVPEP
jgi:hypothetical protein